MTSGELHQGIDGGAGCSLADPFHSSWANLREAALAAEEAGFDGIWVWDHLAGGVHREDRVLESWPVLAAIAPLVVRVNLGPRAKRGQPPPGSGGGHGGDVTGGDGRQGAPRHRCRRGDRYTLRG